MQNGVAALHRMTPLFAKLKLIGYMEIIYNLRRNDEADFINSKKNYHFSHSCI